MQLHRKNNNIKQPDPLPKFPGTKPPTKEYTWGGGTHDWIHSRGWPCQSSLGGEPLSPVEVVEVPKVGKARTLRQEGVGRQGSTLTEARCGGGLRRGNQEGR